MITLKEISLENVVLFKKALFQVEPGLAVVRGKNLDAKIKGQNNGAGKSLLFSSIPNVLFTASPLARRKNSKKDLLSTKGSAISLKFLLQEQEVTLVQKPTAYTIYEDAEDINIRTIPYAEQYIQNKIPSSREEFYSTVYIQSQRECSFSKGTDVERLSFISNVFRLDSYDSLKEIFAKELKLIKDKEIEYSTLLERKNSLASKLEELSWSDQREKKYKTLLVRVEEKESSCEELRNKNQQLLIIKKGLTRLNEVEQDLAEYRAHYKYKNHPEEQVSLLEKEKERALEYENFLAKKEDYLENVRSLKSKIKDLRSYTSYTDTDALLEKEELYEKKIEQLQQKLNDQQEYEDQKKELEKEIAFVLKQNKWTKLPTVPEDIDTQISVYTHLVDTPLAHQDKCPLCSSPIKEDLIKKAQQSLDRLTVLKRLHDLYKNLNAIPPQVPAVDKRELQSLNRKLKKVQTQIEEAEVNNEKYKEKENTQNLLKSIKKPKTVLRPKRSLKEIEKDLRLCSDIIYSLRSKQDIIDSYEEKIDDYELDKIEDQIENLSVEHQAQQQSVLKSRRILKDMEMQRNSFYLYQEEVEEIETSLRTLKKDVSRKKIYEALVEAYGSKGIKIIAIKNIAEVLKKNLNLYGPLIFSENFQFDIEVKPTGLRLLVDRNNGNVSDVRLLSGSESDCFRLLLLASLLPLIPSSRRMNFLILDEPDCHMDEQTRERFIQNMLPAIQEIVPSVIVITPLDTQFNNADEYAVIKQGGISSLEKI